MPGTNGFRRLLQTYLTPQWKQYTVAFAELAQAGFGAPARYAGVMMALNWVSLAGPGVGGLYHFSPDRMKSQVYVRPFLALVGSSGGGTSNSNVGAGVGVGMKWPKLNGRMAWRGEANFMSVNSSTSLGAMLSFLPSITPGESRLAMGVLSKTPVNEPQLRVDLADFRITPA